MQSPVIFPRVEHVVDRLRALQKDMRERPLEVRLQVMSEDSWIVHPGIDDILSQHGFWGGSAIALDHNDDDLCGVALELLAQAYEHYIKERP